MKHFIFIIFNLFSVSVFSQNIIIGFAIPVDSISNIDSEKVPFRFTILDHHFPDAAQIFIPQIEMTKKHHCSKDKCRVIVSGIVYFNPDSSRISLTNTVASVSITNIRLIDTHGIYYEEDKDGVKGSLDAEHDSLFLQKLKENYLIRMKYTHFITAESSKGIGWSECYQFDSK